MPTPPQSAPRTRRCGSQRWTSSPLMASVCLILLSSLYEPAVAGFLPRRPPKYGPGLSQPNGQTQTGKAFISGPLFAAKSGGKMIESDEDFAAIVLAEDSPRPVVAFFSAAWCGPCRLSIPVVKEIRSKFTGEIDVVEICTDDLAETSADCGVVSIPTIQFYYRGELLDTIVGCVARSVLSSAVTKVLEDVAIANGDD